MTTIQVTHRIARINFYTESNAWLPRLQEEPFVHFVVDDAEPDVRLRFHKVPLPDRMSPSDDPASYLLHTPAVRERLQDYLDPPGRMTVELDWSRAVIRDFARRQLDFLYTEKWTRFPSDQRGVEFQLLSNFRQIFATFLPCFSALLIHGAGLVRDERAALFLAPSTGGKTTTVQLSTGEPILSDDQIILRLEDDVVSAHGTPFGRITSGPHGAELGGIFLLEKADRFGLSPLAAVDAIEEIWASLPRYTYFLPTRLRADAFGVLYQACHQAPVYRMRFPRDHVDWAAIDTVMVK